MLKHKHSFKSQIKPSDVDTEDGGQAKIVALASREDEDNGMFIRIHSWDEELKHEEFSKFVGRKVRVTIETID